MTRPTAPDKPVRDDRKAPRSQTNCPTKPKQKQPHKNCPLAPSACHKFQCTDHPQSCHRPGKQSPCKFGSPCPRAECRFSHAPSSSLKASDSTKSRRPDHSNPGKASTKASTSPVKTKPPFGKTSKRGRHAGSREPIKTRVERIYTEEEATTREATSILNKMVPESMEKLTAQLKTLNLSDATLQVITERLFEKALLEPKYCRMYAQLCKALTETEDEARGAFFRRRLLDLCQSAFTTRSEPVLATDSESLLEQERLSRMRMCGNMEFVGELYKQRLIAEKVMTMCFDNLLQKVDNINMECFCKLMTNVGQQLTAKEKNKVAIDAYMVTLTKESQSSTTLDRRTRFIILDLLELYRNGWKARTPKSQTKTIQELRQETQSEKQRPKRPTKTARKPGGPNGAKNKNKKNQRQADTTNRKRSPQIVAPAPINESGAGEAQSVSEPEPDPSARASESLEASKNLTDVTLEEYFGSGDIDEAVACAQEIIDGVDSQIEFVTNSFNYCLDKNKGYEEVCLLIGRLSVDQLIHPTNLVAGLCEIISNLDETTELYPLAPAKVGKAIVTLFEYMDDSIEPITAALKNIEAVPAVRVIAELIDGGFGLSLAQLTPGQLTQYHLNQLVAKLKCEDPATVCSWSLENIDEKERANGAFTKEIFSHIARQIPRSWHTEPKGRQEDLTDQSVFFSTYKPLLEAFVISPEAKTELRLLISRTRDPLKSRIEQYYASLT